MCVYIYMCKCNIHNTYIYIYMDINIYVYIYILVDMVDSRFASNFWFDLDRKLWFDHKMGQHPMGLHFLQWDSKWFSGK